MTRLQQRLYKAGDLMASLGVKPSEMVRMEFYGFDHYGVDTTFHLQWPALARVSHQLGIPRSNVEIEVFKDSLHVTLTSRKTKTKFVAVVLPSEAADFRAAVEHAGGKLPSQSHINGEARKPRGLPAPVLTGD